MALVIPPEAIETVRRIFAEANDASTEQLSANPNLWETSLDMALISKLNHHSTPIELTEGLFIHLQTHFLGGRRLYHNWEIADIGLLVKFRVCGQLVKTKLALLQSKRLYAVEAPGADEDTLDDYGIGFARLYRELEDYKADLAQRTFSFTEQSRYAALKKGDDQEKAIVAYEKEHGLPVHYLFYNPCLIPWSVEVPCPAVPKMDKNVVGARVISSTRLRSAMLFHNQGDSPSLHDITQAETESDGEPEVGRRLEDFVADRVIGCHEGYRTENPEDDTLAQVFFNRTAPIGAAIAITIDIPEG